MKNNKAESMIGQPLGLYFKKNRHVSQKWLVGQRVTVEMPRKDYLKDVPNERLKMEGTISKCFMRFVKTKTHRCCSYEITFPKAFFSDHVWTVTPGKDDLIIELIKEKGKKWDLKG